MNIVRWILGIELPYSKPDEFTPVQEPEPHIVHIQGDETFQLDVVGESHYQENLESICGPRTEKGENRIVDATLILDDNNPYDRNAVKIEIDGKQVGFLARHIAPEFRRSIKGKVDPNAILMCKAKIKGGWEKKNGDTGHYGVRLDIRVEFEE